MHGHVINLLDKGVKTIFYPCMSYNIDEGRSDNHYNCPVVAYYPEVIKVNVKRLKNDDATFINEYVGIHRHKDFAKKIYSKLVKYFPDLNEKEVKKASELAYKEYANYEKKISEKGDEIIEFTAETIVNLVHSDKLENTFVGHIGGDDFVAIVPGTNCEKLCQNIISHFDTNVSKIFTQDGLEKGYIEVANRKGIIEEFPLTTISVGAVEVEPGRFHNTLEIGEAGAQVKHLSKTIPGSTYVIDRRKNRDEYLDKAIKVLENKG